MSGAGRLPADARGDLLVAAAAAGATVGLTLLVRVVLSLPLGVLPRAAPLAVYPLYVLFGRGDTGSRLENPLLWAAVGVLGNALAG